MAYSVNEVHQVTWYFARGPFRAAVTRYFRVVSATNGGPAANAAAQRFCTVFEPLFRACLDGGASLQGAVITEMIPTPGTELGAGFGTLGTGTAAGNGLGPAVCGLVSLSLLPGQRIARGRMYVPFAAGGDNASSATPTASYVSRLNAIGAQLLVSTVASDVGPSPPFPVRTAGFRGTLWHGPGSSNTLVAVAKGRPKWATQRRRAQPPFPMFSPFG